MRTFIVTLAFVGLSLAGVSWAQAGQPVVSRLIITDVNPLSLSVVWVASEPSTCGLRLFDKKKQRISNSKIISESALHPPAEDRGLVKIRVKGLRPNTTYYIQTVTTSKADKKITIYPEKPIPVCTEKSATPVNNCILAQKIYHKNQIKGDGCILIVSVEGGSYPVSGWVGGQPNPPSPWALIDLNNVYSGLTHQNIQLKGSEVIKVEIVAGIYGYAKFTRKLSPPSPKSIFVELGPPIVLNNPQVVAVGK